MAMEKLTKRMSAVDRRSFLTAAIALAAVPAGAQQDFPNKPIRIISPYTAGGLGDTLPRALSVVLSPRLGQRVLVENRPGASQMMGTQFVARAENDGYTLLWASTTNMAINTIAQTRLGYDPQKDFAPIGVCFTSPLYLLVNPRLPVKSVKELIAYAKAHPGKLTFASGGSGSTNHLAGELFMQQTGIRMLHVPYKGAGPAIVGVIGGEVDLMFEGAGIEHARHGQLRALAVASRQRTHGAPDVPTIAEAGVPGFDASVWFGLAAPAGTPPAVVARLASGLQEALKDPALVRSIGDAEITPSSPQAMADLVRTDTDKWRKVVVDAHIVFE
ncbi:Argininosuccinate lyase [Variovorax sp. SRS16]|nr:Argininosuccinate lyase [Variovorax sp. SRS16]